jgi:hypothetical protein
MQHDGSNEDVLTRLAQGRGKAEPAFLAAHHLAAALRFEQLVRRAQLSPRLTMSYNPASVGGRDRSANAVETASESSAEARMRLARLADAMSPDCWGVVFDVCGLGKGLQLVEVERRWPRRSAKLVLRIGLDQIAVQFGLSAHASGRETGGIQGWLPDRLPLIKDS